MTTKNRNIEEYSVTYNQLPFEDILVKYRKKLALQQIQKFNPTSLLEVGCGNSPLFTDLPNNINITIIEPAPKFAKQAESLDGKNVTVLNDYLEQANINSKFDFIVVSSLLHELSDRTAFLKELIKYCHKDTILHFNVPNKNSLHRLLAVAMGLIDSPDNISDNQKSMNQEGIVFDLETLKSFLGQYNLIEINSGGLFVKPFTHKQMQSLVDGGFLTEKMLDGLSELAYTMQEYSSEIWVNVRLGDG